MFILALIKFFLVLFHTCATSKSEYDNWRSVEADLLFFEDICSLRVT